MFFILVYSEDLSSACMCIEIFIQVECESASDGLLELSRSEAKARRQAAKNAHRNYEGTERIRSLPGLSHVTYGWMPVGCRGSFLELLYPVTPSKGCTQSGMPVERLAERSVGEKSSKTASEGRTPRRRRDKWPVHGGLTLICDSRRCHISVLGSPVPVERLRPADSYCAVGRSGTATERHASSKHCNKWSVHSGLTLICD